MPLNAGLVAVLIAATPQVDFDPDLVRPNVVLSVVGNAMLHRGNHVRLMVRTDRDAYLTLYRVNTDGKLSILYPISPDSQPAWTPMVSRGVRDPSGSLGNNTFTIDDFPGVGYVFVIASPVPFDYAAMRDTTGWNLDGLIEGSRVPEDADAMIADIAVATLPDTVPFSYDEQRYLVGATPPPIVALPCLGCFPFAGHPFLIPVREWCGTFAEAPVPDPWTPAVGMVPIPVISAVVGPGVAPADIVSFAREQIKHRERQIQAVANPIESLVSGVGAPTPANRRVAKLRGTVTSRTTGGRNATAPRRRQRH